MRAPCAFLCISLTREARVEISPSLGKETRVPSATVTARPSIRSRSIVETSLKENIQEEESGSWLRGTIDQRSHKILSVFQRIFHSVQKTRSDTSSKVL